MVSNYLTCKSNINLSFPLDSCPDEEGGTFNEPEAERRLAEARAAKLKDFQGNDLVIYSTILLLSHFPALFVIYGCLILYQDMIKLLLHNSFKVVWLKKSNKLCLLPKFSP